MAEILGRKASVTIGGNTVATGRTKNLTINNELIDVTGDDDAGIQRMLNEPGQKAVEFTYDGLFDTEDTTLLDQALDGSDVSAEVVVTFPTTAGSFTLTGTFLISSFSLGAPYNEATTFSASFNSSGAVAKAVAP